MEPGAAAPLGATVQAGGVNFSVFSKHATRVDLLLFDDAEDARPARVLTLDPRRHRTYHYWHVFVPGLAAGQVTPTVRTGRSLRSGASGSTATRCCSTPTASRWRCRAPTIGERHARR